eukprot:scaffold1239_cov175-Pinguiococcus_pyrenoidosus.AAC.23
MSESSSILLFSETGSRHPSTLRYPAPLPLDWLGCCMHIDGPSELVQNDPVPRQLHARSRASFRGRSCCGWEPLEQLFSRRWEARAFLSYFPPKAGNSPVTTPLSRRNSIWHMSRISPYLVCSASRYAIGVGLDVLQG